MLLWSAFAVMLASSPRWPQLALHLLTKGVGLRS
jgi:hypothetical protein